MLTTDDKELLKKRGISETQLESQLDQFKSGFPYLKIYDSARPGEGITVLDAEGEKAAVARWDKFLADGGTVTKFVPASGAASRMFKALFAFVDSADERAAEGSDVDKLLKGIHDVAFFGELNAVCERVHGKSVDQLLAEGKQKEIIAAIIKEDGLNYGNLPKGLLTFHHAAEGTRTPVEEQLMEGAQSARQADGAVNMHLTVSGSHREGFEKKLAEAVPAIESRMGVKIHVDMSEQKPSTDTVAVNDDNTPFREEGHLVFRPGGHGALIQNLNEIGTEVVFIKNIDNVVPDNQRAATLQYKKVIAGYLMELHDKAAAYMDLLDSRSFNEANLNEICGFLRSKFSFDAPELDALKGEELADYLRSKLDRPMRVCGMVRNEGEPGGGPYITRNSDGSRSLQILESSQIDLSKEENRDMMAKATHFNPVDLVCYVRDYKGGKYDLPSYVDPETGFISSKSLHGRSLKALELPGLWNGAMSDWLTAFVEVPIATFNPVKTVNDLLRPVHSGK
ncbi:MAG: DUF4301 family protein [[Clostridium] fimetarium]|nr:DUF4301 family protein [Alistipes timonensis]MCM1405621.1 DUF4301 family protein [[Clostridium] fimetarium]